MSDRCFSAVKLQHALAISLDVTDRMRLFNSCGRYPQALLNSLSLSHPPAPGSARRRCLRNSFSACATRISVTPSAIAWVRCRFSWANTLTRKAGPASTGAHLQHNSTREVQEKVHEEMQEDSARKNA